ncbi:hypothetical protein [Holospora elegans]|nr:hypothetical protein [Holospora elegans]
MNVRIALKSAFWCQSDCRFEVGGHLGEAMRQNCPLPRRQRYCNRSR